MLLIAYIEAGHAGYGGGFGHQQISNIAYTTHHGHPPPVQHYHGGGHSYVSYADHSSHQDVGYYNGGGYNHNGYVPQAHGGGYQYNHNGYDESFNYNVCIL